MPCLLLVLALAFPRVIIVLLWFFTNFFHGVYQGIVIPILGFLFLPLTLLVYTYETKTYGHMGAPQLIGLAIAVIIDLGLVGSHRMSSSRS
jgi:hypothetical protein